MGSPCLRAGGPEIVQGPDSGIVAPPMATLMAGWAGFTSQANRHRPKQEMTKSDQVRSTRSKH